MISIQDLVKSEEESSITETVSFSFSPNDKKRILEMKQKARDMKLDRKKVNDHLREKIMSGVSELEIILEDKSA